MLSRTNSGRIWSVWVDDSRVVGYSLTVLEAKALAECYSDDGHLRVEVDNVADELEGDLVLQVAMGELGDDDDDEYVEVSLSDLCDTVRWELSWELENQDDSDSDCWTGLG